ncbi:hypothetical protein QFW77_16725 [Luteimonas sp. RD2P54]|uniref:Uncharacterized protein n=1 Tax=Luteimonas endophytica TaxID=3042023 RepID=A0ABT6JDA4_9GAMM|nr:hypothetical protein [Luteimonas endophytica]MDH5824617.1 hypothetical protein [Luteimonas endophytica]
MSTRYFIRLPSPETTRASGEYAFRSQGAAGFAEELQEALRGDALFARWRDAQEDPDGVDPALGVTDPQAKVDGEQNDLHIDLVANTSIPGNVLKHRLRLLAGGTWQLRDVRGG